MDRETTDKRIVYARTRKVEDNNETRKVLFVNLYAHKICKRFALGLLRKIFWNYRRVVVQW